MSSIKSPFLNLLRVLLFAGSAFYLVLGVSAVVVGFTTWPTFPGLSAFAFMGGAASFWMGVVAWPHS